MGDFFFNVFSEAELPKVRCFCCLLLVAAFACQDAQNDSNGQLAGQAIEQSDTAVSGGQNLASMASMSQARETGPEYSCESGYFDHDDDTRTPCEPCASECTAGTTETQACTSITNRICAQCPAGSYDHDSDSQTGCVACTVLCVAGTTEIQACTGHSDRVCESCVPGFFDHDSDASTPCEPCRQECESELIEAIECTPTSDRVCERCPRNSRGQMGGAEAVEAAVFCDPDDHDGDGVSDEIEIELGTDPRAPDSDMDGIGDYFELQCTTSAMAETECPISAPDTLDSGTPDALNSDVDEDGIADGEDNCFATANVEQNDQDGDGRGDLCDSDVDGDRVSVIHDCDDRNPMIGARRFDSDCDGWNESRNRVSAISAGWQTTCGILESGRLRCYGADDDEALTVPNQANGDPFSDWAIVSTGNQTACAIHENGILDCFGEDAPQPPVDPRGQALSDWVTVSVGGGLSPFACGIRFGGQLLCWNTHRSMGEIPSEMADRRDWVDVSAGVSHVCARSTNDEVMCFGNCDLPVNDFGQCSPPSEYQGRWAGIDSGYFHSCGRLDTGRIMCFGVDDDDQLGVPADEGGDPITRWQSVSVGGFHGCGLLDNHRVQCWGSDDYAQSTVPMVNSPWLAVSAGRYHTCGQVETGHALCWGWNSRGERDVPFDTIFKRPANLDNCPGLRNSDQSDIDGDGLGDVCDDDRDGDGLANEIEPRFFLDPNLHDSDGDGLDDGLEFGCDPQCPDVPNNTILSTAIDALNIDTDSDGVPDGSDNCRRRPNSDQFDLDQDGIGNICDNDRDGDGVLTAPDCDDDNPALGLRARDLDCDGILYPAVNLNSLVVAGESLTCALDVNGALSCAGQDHYRQTNVLPAFNGLPFHDWLTVSAGFSHACGVHIDGRMTCWGAGYDGRGTPPSVDQRGEPITWQAVSTGFAHTCALDTGGRMFCFGSNFDGQCDVPLDPLTGNEPRFRSLSAGGFHTCGVLTDGRLLCFGSNDARQQPNIGAEGLQFVSVASGREHTCALTDFGEIKCWSAQNRVVVPRTDQGQIIRDWVMVSAGRNHTCGLREGGRLICFGDGQDAQLDLNGSAEVYITVSAGGYHTCAVDTAFQIRCAGRDDHGQTTTLMGNTAFGGIAEDNCPFVANPSQADQNADGIGDLCENGVEGAESLSR